MGSCLFSTSCEIALFWHRSVYILWLPAVAARAKNYLSRGQMKLNSWGIVYKTIENVFSCALTIDKLDLSLCCQNNDRPFRANTLKGGLGN